MDRMHARRAALAGVHEHSCHESRWRLPRYSMSIENIRSDFALLDDWEDRYRYLIELGRALAPLPESLRTDANKVRGCASQVWLASATGRNGTDAPAVLRIPGRQRCPHRARADRRAVRPVRRQDGGGHPAHRRTGGVCGTRAQGAPHPAALERLLLHGRAHPQRRTRARHRGTGAPRASARPSNVGR